MARPFRFLLVCALFVVQAACGGGGGGSSGVGSGGGEVDGGDLLRADINDDDIALAMRVALEGTEIDPVSNPAYETKANPREITRQFNYTAILAARIEAGEDLNNLDAIAAGVKVFSARRVNEEETPLIRNDDGTDYVLMRVQDEVLEVAAGTTMTLAAREAHAWRFDAVTTLASPGDSDFPGPSMPALRMAKPAKHIEEELSFSRAVQAQGGAQWNGGDGVKADFAPDAYIYESSYSGFGLWAERPAVFFSAQTGVTLAEADGDGLGVFYYGFETGRRIPRSGVDVVYRGGAVGYMLTDINSGVAAARNIVGGDVTLRVNFDDGSVGGGVQLTAHLPRNLEDASGTLHITLSDGMINGDGTFSGDVEIAEVPWMHPFLSFRADETSADLTTPAEVTAESGFAGLFTGPRGAEASGAVFIETAGSAAADGVDRLGFGFLVDGDT